MPPFRNLNYFSNHVTGLKLALNIINLCLLISDVFINPFKISPVDINVSSIRSVTSKSLT